MRSRLTPFGGESFSDVFATKTQRGLPALRLAAGRCTFHLDDQILALVPVSFHRDRCFDVSNQARGCCISGSAAKPISVLGLYRRQNDSHCGTRMIITKVTRLFQQDKNQYGGDCLRAPINASMARQNLYFLPPSRVHAVDQTVSSRVVQMRRIRGESCGCL